MKLYLFVLFVISVTICKAQQYDCNCDADTDPGGHKVQSTLVFNEYHNPINNFRGGQFINTWSKGAVTLLTGETINDMMLRYDMFSDELLWLRETDFVTGIVNRNIVSSFRIFTDEKELFFEKREVKHPGTDTADSYLQMLAEGELDLMVYRNVVKAVSESRTVDNTIYYLYTEDKNFSSVRLNRRSLLNCPGIDRERMKNVLRENKIAPKNELNFTRAVYLYNQSGS